MNETNELAALREWSRRVYGAIEHEEWAHDLIIDLAEIWNGRFQQSPEVTINATLVEEQLGRPVDWDKTGWKKEERV